jgi:hypothetical protein
MSVSFRYRNLPEWLRWMLWLPLTSGVVLLLLYGSLHIPTMLGLDHYYCGEFLLAFMPLSGAVFFAGYFAPSGRMGFSVFVALTNLGYMIFQFCLKGFAAFFNGASLLGSLAGIATGLVLIRCCTKKSPAYRLPFFLRAESGDTRQRERTALSPERMPKLEPPSR